MEFTPPYNLLHYLYIGRFASVYIATWWERYGNMASEQKGGAGDVGDCYDYERTCGAKKKMLTMRARN